MYFFMSNKERRKELLWYCIFDFVQIGLFEFIFDRGNGGRKDELLYYCTIEYLKIRKKVYLICYDTAWFKDN